jgi:hypothetical protein
VSAVQDQVKQCQPRDSAIVPDAAKEIRDMTTKLSNQPPMPLPQRPLLIASIPQRPLLITEGAARFLSSAREWESQGVRVEWVDAKKAPRGLSLEERETSIAFVESDTYADVMTCSSTWMRRLEMMGAKPWDILAFERGDGEMRKYRIPRKWVRRPYPADSQRKPGEYRCAAEWAAEGILLQHTADHFGLPEQETSVNFLQTGVLAEVNTCRKDWHRRLEGEGARPESIDAARDGGGEFRWYKIPRHWVKLPAATGRR